MCTGNSRVWLIGIFGSLLLSQLLAPAFPLVLADTVTSKFSSNIERKTAYPGGRWEPDAPKFGKIDVSTWLVMDDGIKLRVTIGYPSNRSTGKRAAGPFPVILQHSPYTDTPVEYFVEHGYIFVNVLSLIHI